MLHKERKNSILLSCVEVDSKVQQQMYDCDDQRKLLRSTAEFGVEDFHIYNLSAHASRNVVFDNYA